MADAQATSAAASSTAGATAVAAVASAPTALQLAQAAPLCRSIVLDLGGDTIKTGWAGQRAPSKLIPNCAVRPKASSKAAAGDRWIVGDAMLPEEVSLSVPAKAGGAPGQQTSKVMKSKIQDYSGLAVRRPQDRGFIVNWELESQILSRALHRSVLDPHNTLSSALSLGSTANLVEECSVLVTLPVLAPSRFAADLDENVLEKWAAKRYRRIQCAPLAHRGVMDEVYPPTAAAAAFPGASAAAAAAPSASAAASAAGAAAGASSKEPLHRLVALVVDSGYSFTHILPVYRGSIITTAARRLNIGGKLLTNYLKELVSFRAWNMMDETWIINDVKEKCCYVSTDFEREIQAAKKSRKVAEKIRRDYVLPNGSTVLEGYVLGSAADSGRPLASAAASAAAGAATSGSGAGRATASEDDQLLSLLNERFAVPEVLFNPGDIGMPAAGLCELIAQSIAASPAWMQPLLWDNIVLVGGNARMANMGVRMERELRSMAPAEYRITVRTGRDPVLSAWVGGAAMAAEPDAVKTLQYVTKDEFAEWGSEGLTRKWDGDDDEGEGAAAGMED